MIQKTSKYSEGNLNELLSLLQSEKLMVSSDIIHLRDVFEKEDRAKRILRFEALLNYYLNIKKGKERAGKRVKALQGMLDAELNIINAIKQQKLQSGKEKVEESEEEEAEQLLKKLL